MKNLHLIPTDKPSRVYKHLGRELKHTVRYFEQKGLLCINQHIYITSDEEIKEDDWMIWNNRVVQAIDTTYYSAKKIILTTDQDLIKDGVQAIDDEFLESFVKNPSCEFVEVVKYDGYLHFKYMVIIPKEEPKQETLDFISKELDIERKRVHKQETLEEAAKRLHQKGLKDDLSLSFHDGVKFGAKWQEERMYSEEDIMKAMHSVELKYNRDLTKVYEGMKEWFEQFKKK